MPRIPVLAFVALASVLLLETPAQGQSAEEIEKEEIERLIAQLGHEDVDVRCNAAHGLGMIGPKAAPAVPALIEALSDEDHWVRENAVFALGSMGPKASPAVPGLITALSDENLLVRAYAAEVLGKIGPKAAPAVPALIAALSEENPAVRQTFAEALGGIGIDLQTLWWVVPRVYWKELVGLVLLLVGWFALLGRFPKHRPASKLKHLAPCGAKTPPPQILRHLRLNARGIEAGPTPLR